MKLSQISILALFALILGATSCEKDDPIIPNEEELITSVNFTLTPQDGGTSVLLSFQDLDGDGGSNPIITGGVLQAETTYEGSLQFFNEQEVPVDDITAEVREEDEEHQLFYQSDLPGLTIDYNDQDANGDPLGLITVITTAGPGTGNITVILRHEPDKSASGVSNGDITNAGGETDIQVSFPVEVQ